MPSHYNIHNKSVVITGASRGLGQAIATVAAKQGAKRIWAATRDITPPLWLSTLGDLATRVVHIELDVTEPESIRRAVSEIGDANVVFNNAAICCRTGILEMSMEQIRLEWETNFFGPLQVTRAVTTMFSSLDIIANIGSKFRYVGPPEFGNYAATKSALATASESTRSELSRRRINIQTFVPGTMDTNMARSSVGPKADAVDIATAIFQKLGSEDADVLLSPDAIDTYQEFFANPDEARKRFGL